MTLGNYIATCNSCGARWDTGTVEPQAAFDAMHKHWDVECDHTGLLDPNASAASAYAFEPD